MSNRFTCKWVDSVEEISPEDWEKIYGKDVIKNQDFLLANEMAQFEDVTFKYLLVFRNGIIHAIVPCFNYKIDILNLTTAPSLKSGIRYIRKYFPSFLKIQAFVIGTYAATCEHFIGFSIELPQKEHDEISQIISSQIKEQCRKDKCSFVFVKDIREHDLNNVRNTLSSDYRYFVSFPTTAIPILKDTPYPNGLRKKNRKRYHKYLKSFNSSFYWETITDFSGQYSTMFHSLYSAVLNKANNKFEILNEKFFSCLNKLFESNSYLLIARDKSTKEVRVMELVLEGKDRLVPLYLGINYKDDDTKVLYLNTIFRTVKDAEEKGLDYVDLGQTSYYPKTMSGALTENIYYGFWSEKLMYRWLINNVLHIVFKQHDIPKHVYLEEYNKLAHEVLEHKGWILRN